MKRLTLVLVVMSFLQPALSRAAEVSDLEARYQAMLTAAKANPATTDWQALRFAYADRPSFSPRAADEGRKALQAARATHNWQSMLTAANAMLDVDYVDGAAHLGASIALGELGKVAEADQEQKIGVAIFKSMMLKGDGKSKEQAFVVISVAEEYELMAARQRHITKQRLDQDGVHSYDVIDAADQNGDTITFYFQIDRVLASEAKMLGN